LWTSKAKLVTNLAALSHYLNSNLKHHKAEKLNIFFENNPSISEIKQKRIQMGGQKIVLLSIFVCFYVFSLVSCTEFEAGGENGWIIPQSSNQSDIFNQWASKNRFKVGDTIRKFFFCFYYEFMIIVMHILSFVLIWWKGFKYKKDSVLVVTEDEYKKCQTTKPELYSNHDDTVFKLDRPGLFYFISGVSGHCEQGQKMIIKVMEVESTPQSPPPSSSLPASAHKKNHAVRKTSRFLGAGLVTISILVITVFSLV